MAVNRYYSSTAQQATLTNSVNSSATVLQVSGTTGFPVLFPYTLILDRGNASEEVVTVTSAVSTNLTVTRGEDGTSAVSHSLGATVEHGVSARDHREAQEHIAASTGVHGVSGSVVGTTGTQTLTGKTLTAPTITNPTITGGGSWAGSPTLTTPTIADFSNATHTHAAAGSGGNIPQTSVTGLDARLTSIESVNTTQGTTLSSHTTELADHETRIANNEALPAAILTNSTNQNVVNNSGVALAFNTEVFDNANGHSTVTNNSRYTVPTGWAGVWRISATVPFVSSTSQGKFEVYFQKNGVTSYAGSSIVKDNSNITPIVSASRLISLVVGDYIEVLAFQNTGVTQAVDSTFKGGAQFDCEWIRS